MNRLLDAVAARVQRRFPPLGADQCDGTACVHCGARFTPQLPGEPARRRTARRQCAGYCLVVTAPGLTGAFRAAIRAARPVRFLLLGGGDLVPVRPDRTVEIVAGRTRAASGSVSAEHARRLARQAAQLGFDADIIEYRDEENTR